MSYIVVVERNGHELVVYRMSYPPIGQKPIGYNPDTYIKIEPDVYMIVGPEDDEFQVPYQYPTQQDAERWAEKLDGARVEFVP